MLGSTIIYEPDCIKLAGLGEVDNIEDVVSVDLETLSLVDLYPLLQDKSIRLLEEDEPVIEDAENDIVALGRGREDLEFAAGNDVDLSAVIALVEEFLAPLEGLFAGD